MTTGPAAETVDVVLTAGGRSTDPGDPFFVALEAVGGRLIRRGVPAHPGSMLWLGRVRHTAVLGLPTCGAYSKATAADLLLPRLLTGEPPTLRTVSRLGHGGILTRDMRFRFPAYARPSTHPTADRRPRRSSSSPCADRRSQHVGHGPTRDARSEAASTRAGPEPSPRRPTRR